MLLQEAGAIFRARGDRGGYLLALLNLGALARDQGNYAQAITMLEEALALARDIGSKGHIAAVSHDLAETALMLGDIVRAEALEQVAFTLWRELKHLLSGIAAINLAYLALERGDVAQSREFLVQNLVTLQPIDGFPCGWRHLPA